MKLSIVQHPRHHHCCKGGLVFLPYPSRLPGEFFALFDKDTFLQDIRAYNNMFSMMSFGENVDKDVNDNRSPYVLMISRQISHKIIIIIH